jgi:hypothetical protein
VIFSFPGWSNSVPMNFLPKKICFICCYTNVILASNLGQKGIIGIFLCTAKLDHKQHLMQKNKQK